MWQSIVQIAPYAVGYAMPLLITALGGLYSERSGIINIGLEGLMVIGSYLACLTVRFLAPSIGYIPAAWLGVLLAMGAGAIFSLLHAFASITLNADQTISGIAINLLATALVVYTSRKFIGTSNLVINSMTRVDIPLLEDIPFIGELFFRDTYPTTWLIIAVLGISAYVIAKTPFGLRLRACGEYPEAAEAGGVNVAKMRYTGVLLSGICAGMGGGVYTLTVAGQCNGSVAGLGFLAIAALIFGQWRTGGILLSTLFFGFALTLAQVSQLIPSLAMMPPLTLKLFPYVVTLITLVLFSKSSRAPRAEGKYFDYRKS
ncbi:MAG: ABC transporter permease [Clostridia bacterium]